MSTDVRSNNFSNVVNLANFAQTIAPAKQEALAFDLLINCRDLFLATIEKVLIDKRRELEFNLISSEDSSTNLEVRDLYRVTRAIIKTRYSELLNAIRKDLKQRFEFIEPARNKPVEGLTLMDDHTLEVSIAVDEVADRLQLLTAEQLLALDQRLRHIAKLLKITVGAAPITAKVLVDTFMNACKELERNAAVQLILLKQFDEIVSPELAEVLHKLNTYLIEQNILPEIPSNRTTPLKPTRPSAQDSEDMLGLLQQLIDSKGGRSPASSLNAGTQSTQGGLELSLPSRNLVATLTTLQQAQAIDSTSTNSAQLTGQSSAVPNLRYLQNNGLISTGTKTDALILDIVAMLFEFIFNDDKIPVQMRALIGKLQIPVLKAALIDKQFFSKKSHPVRMFLDELAKIALEWDASDDPDHYTYAAVKTIIDRINNEFLEDISLFSIALNELQAIADNPAIAESPPVQAAVGELSLIDRNLKSDLFAKRSVESALAKHTDSDKLPDLIVSFVKETWKLVLMEAYVKYGEASTEVSSLEQITDKLLWSVVPKTTASARTEFVQALPGLLQGLRAGLDSIEVDSDQRDLIFSFLVDLHSNAVRVAQIPDSRDPGSKLSIGDGLNRLKEVLARLAKRPLPSSAVAAAVSKKYGLTSEAPAPTCGETPVELDCSFLKKGLWVTVQLGQAQIRKVKLIWISPTKELYLFTNAFGLDPLTYTKTRLLNLLAAGAIQIIDSDSFTEKTVGKVVTRLSEAAHQ